VLPVLPLPGVDRRRIRPAIPLRSGSGSWRIRPSIRLNPTFCDLFMPGRKRPALGGARETACWPRLLQAFYGIRSRAAAFGAAPYNTAICYLAGF